MSKAENNPTINDKITQLHEMTEWFYGEDFSLDQATDKYQQAINLTKEIEKDLAELKNQVELIDKDFTNDEN